jgi:hypothetical protein
VPGARRTFTHRCTFDRHAFAFGVAAFALSVAGCLAAHAIDAVLIGALIRVDTSRAVHPRLASVVRDLTKERAATQLVARTSIGAIGTVGVAHERRATGLTLVAGAE